MAIHAKGAAPPSLALVVDTDPATHKAFAGLMENLGLRVVGASTGIEALEKFYNAAPAVVLLDFDLPDMEGLHLVRRLRDNGINVPVIVLTASPDIRTAVEATRAGATEFLDKATSLEQLRSAVESALRASATQRPLGPAPDSWERDRASFFRQHEQLFRLSEKMRAIERLVVEVADTNATVLIQGETGVGKELVAKALHYLSDRSARPWLKVNCASLPPDLLESELFGHEKGAFTGAVSRKPGRFELANGGTLFLDEIGEMPLGLQSKILHVLQDGEFFRVGGRELISVDVRIIAATNRNIQTMVAGGLFREDLYYRLNVVSIVVPPLRERREEIAELVENFCERFNRQFNRRRPRPSAETMDLLLAYSWAGNVREMENLLKRYVVLGDEPQLREELSVRFRFTGQETSPPVAPAERREVDLGLREIARRAAQEAEKAAVLEVLKRVQWNRAATARLLKISYKALLNKLNQWGIERKRPPQRKG
ncbi:MAG: sigma-54-dependent Fis family transcriptional regulator [Candidatus Rokubacteria bacterium]|nr:sigma-54-dependent Fis family transcriptional regulator [Candidatus Rokubacteria bacterium]